MIKVASSLLDTASKWLDDNPAAATGLLTGGLGALGGFALTGADPDESTGESLKRRLRNALIVGGLAGGAGALGSKALSSFGTSHEAPLPPPVPTVATKARKIGLDALGAGLGAYGGYALGDKMLLSGLPLIGQKSKLLDLAKANKLSDSNGASVALEGLRRLAAQATTADELNKVVGGYSGQDAANLLRSLGIAGTDKIADVLEKTPRWINTRTILKTLTTAGGAIAGGIGAHKLQNAFLDN